MRIRKVLLLTISIVFNSCNGQNKENPYKKIKSEMREKFDFEIYKKTENGTYDYKLPNGNIIHIMDFDKNGGFQWEYSPDSLFTSIYKEFYANGYIKRKETYMGEKTKVDISEYYDEDGDVEKVDENKKFGKIKPIDVLKFLEDKKIINLKTGSGRFLENGQPSFEIQFDEKSKNYIITIVNGRPNTPENFPEIGEPLAFLPLIYEMDGETGKVVEIQ